MSREKFEADLTAATNKAKSELQDGYIDEATAMDQNRDRLKAEIPSDVSALEEKRKQLAEIEGKPAEKEMSVEIKEKVRDWENFLKKRFPETQFDLSKLEIPKRTPEEEKEFTRLLFRTGKLPLFKKCAELFPSINHSSTDLDKFIAENAGEDSFIWVRDVEAADKEHKDKSGNMAKKEGLNAETISDRIMHELKYFDETGDHLDKNTGTLTSSRGVHGVVLDAFWNDGKFRVIRVSPDNLNDDWRFRQVVSSPTKSEK